MTTTPGPLHCYPDCSCRREERPMTGPDHPHDGYAYDGCKCTCCRNVRALAWKAEARADVDGPEDPASRIPYGQPCPHCGPKGHAYHADDSYGACVTCREYVPHTDAEYRAIAWPCPAARADVVAERSSDALDGLVEQLQKAAQLVIGYGVGNLTGPKYHARVAALDVLGDALEALLAGDKAEAPHCKGCDGTDMTLGELVRAHNGDKAEAPE